LLEELRGGLKIELEYAGSTLDDDTTIAIAADELLMTTSGAKLELLGGGSPGPGIYSGGSSWSPYESSNKLSLPSLHDKTATPNKTATNKNRRTFFIIPKMNIS
jgi:hypothetical protein